MAGPDTVHANQGARPIGEVDWLGAPPASPHVRKRGCCKVIRQLPIGLLVNFVITVVLMAVVQASVSSFVSSVSGSILSRSSVPRYITAALAVALASSTLACALTWTLVFFWRATRQKPVVDPHRTLRLSHTVSTAAISLAYLGLVAVLAFELCVGALAISAAHGDAMCSVGLPGEELTKALTMALGEMRRVDPGLRGAQVGAGDASTMCSAWHRALEGLSVDVVLGFVAVLAQAQLSTSVTSWTLPLRLRTCSQDTRADVRAKRRQELLHAMQECKREISV